jgi:predicted nucleic-acid-binding protein
VLPYRRRSSRFVTNMQFSKRTRRVACASTAAAVLAECVFVLESFYGHPRIDIASALGRLISSPGVEINAAIHLEALDRYRKTKVHFVDCLIAATAATEDIPVASFDQ